jgi:hypothetical protein
MTINANFKSAFFDSFFWTAHPRRDSSMANHKLVVGLILTSFCLVCVVYNDHYISERSILKGIKYDCTNSVDCLNIPTHDQKDDDANTSPSDFLKNVVAEIASEDRMPKKSDRYLAMAKELADVGVKELHKARDLRGEADLDDDKAQRLEKTLIQLTAAYHSKKSVAQWYQEQAAISQKMAQKQKTSLKEQEQQDAQLSKQIKEQAELLEYVDKKHYSKNIDKKQSSVSATKSDEWQPVSIDTSRADLQKAFEQGGKQLRK